MVQARISQIRSRGRAPGKEDHSVDCGKGLRYLELTVLLITVVASPIRAQCKALFGSVPVPGSFEDAGANCVTATLIDVGDGTVADRANRLLWAKAAANVSYSSFSDFGAYCGGLVLGGRRGWYLPDVAQLQTLLPPGTCHAVMDGCGSGDPDIPSYNGILWADSTVEPYSYYCPAGFGCHAYMWAVATGLGTNFGFLRDVSGTPPRKRVDARDITEGNLVRCVADGLKLAITPDPVKIPAKATLSGGRLLTESRLALELTEAVGPVGGVVLTLRSNRPTLDTIDGPQNATGADGLTEAFVSTRNQDSQSTIDSTTPLVWTEPKGVITWLPARYVTPFHVTCYITALESDYSANVIKNATSYTWCGSYVPPSGRKYRDAFMRDVRTQGSGQADGGEIVQYSGRPSSCYYISSCPLTASGACAQLGTTVAVDPTVIPFRGSIVVDTQGARLAQDTGQAIQGYDIDEYRGVGLAQCSGWTNPQLGVDFQSY